MAARFHPLPVELFEEALRPAISRLNFELRDLFSLEGSLTSPSSAGKSDSSISRNAITLVHSSRITPAISTTFFVERVASLGAAPPKVIFKVKIGPPDELWVSMPKSDGVWDWGFLYIMP
jgi:hypothetical protein